MSSTTKAARKGVSRFGRMFGLGAERMMREPQLVAVSDGLVVTTTAAEAWFLLSSANTDLMPESAQDAEQDAAALALAKILPGYDCHLKVIWARLSGEEYRAEARQIFTAGDIEAFASMWAQRLGLLDLPQRHILLGVKLAERGSATAASVKNAPADLLGIGHTGSPPVNSPSSTGSPAVWSAAWSRPRGRPGSRRSSCSHGPYRGSPTGRNRLHPACPPSPAPPWSV